MVKLLPEQEDRGESRSVVRRRGKRSLFFVTILLITAFIFWQVMRKGDFTDDMAFVNGRMSNVKLLTLPANRWVRIAPKLPEFIHKIPFAYVRNLVPVPRQDWSRQRHAGLAFDSKRDTLLIFGSDSHGENWDNSVHEFSPLTLEWTTHYPASPKETYRANEQGFAIAGEKEIYPWAMHTFDNIVYAPEIGSLIVSSKVDHTPPPTEEAKKTHANPTWIYHLNSHRWEILRQKDAPSFFGAGSTYDASTASVWAYQHGQLWRLDLNQGEWKKIPGHNGADLQMHFTMTTDVLRHQFMFFGDYGKSNAIWVYTPSSNPDQEGSWEKRQPTGDPCPKAGSFPVAYDSRQGVFLLIPDESPQRSVTLVYSPSDNRYIRVNGADMPANGMNYMMEYDPYNHVFLLVTGDWKTPVAVWAFRLDMGELERH
jgi:hypothetical protein